LGHRRHLALSAERPSSRSPDLDEPAARTDLADLSPAGLLALQRAAGNRAVGQMLARYSQPTTAYSFGAPDPNARTPFTLAEDHPSVMPRTTPGAPGMGAGFAATTPAKPPILVSDDGTMAINSQAGEPREFYATQDVITHSNTELAKVGAPVKLGTGGNRITPTGSAESLEMVTPHKTTGPAPAQNEFIGLVTSACRDIAAHVMGGQPQYMKVGGSRMRGITAGDPVVVTGTHELAESMAQGETAAQGRKAVEQAGSAANAPRVGKEYGTKLGAGQLDAQAQALGVNQFAEAEIGEAYMTQRIENLGETLAKDYSQGGAQHAFTWGYHFAAVVAKSRRGDDSVTLENYNRAGDLEEARKLLLADLETRFALQLTGYLAANPPPNLTVTATDDAGRKLQEGANDRKRLERIGEILYWLEHAAQANVQQAKDAYQAMHDERLSKGASLWYFRMVGKQAGQSFHEQMAASGYFSNPLTAAVGPGAVAGKIVAYFDEGKADLKPADDQKLDVMARMFLIDMPKGRTARIRVTGFGSGGGVGTAKSRAKKQHDVATRRADTVRAFLESKGVQPQFIVVGYGTPEAGWDETESRRVETVAE
jgi:outer membrane protein OmpA-like peptidoglycan-associated protein